MSKIKLTAIRSTWGDGRVTIYESPDKKLYVEFCHINDDNQFSGCYVQLQRYSNKEILSDQYVAIIDKKHSLRYLEVERELNGRPRVASDWFQLHAIDTILERTERPPKEIKEHIPS